MDIPLLLENKINNKKDILIFVDQKNRQSKRLKKRINFNKKLFNEFKKFNLRLDKEEKIKFYYQK